MSCWEPSSGRVAIWSQSIYSTCTDGHKGNMGMMFPSVWFLYYRSPACIIQGWIRSIQYGGNVSSLDVSEFEINQYSDKIRLKLTISLDHYTVHALYRGRGYISFKWGFCCVSVCVLVSKNLPGAWYYHDIAFCWRYVNWDPAGCWNDSVFSDTWISNTLVLLLCIYSNALETQHTSDWLPTVFFVHYSEFYL